jgi:hypothetical protein
MAYQTGDSILDDHYNAFVTSVNANWGAGTGDAGYGQSNTVSAVSTSDAVSAAQWVTLLARVTSMKNQQGSSITAYADPQAGDVIQALTAIATNIATTNTNRLTAAATGSAITTTITNTATFTGTITATATLTFAGGNEARYFFNTGGRVTAAWALSGGTSDPKYDNWAALATACGTYYVYAQTSGKSGGSGSATTNNTNYGYYDISTTPTIAFKQLEDTSPYTASYIQLSLSNSAADGDDLGNNGAVMTFKSEWVDAAADSTSYNKNIYNVLDQVDGNKVTTYSCVPSATTYVTSTWGTPAWATTVNTHS